jgi:hypothetical protein
MLAWRRRLSSDLVMGDGKNSQDDGSQHEHEAQGDPDPVGDSPDGKNTLTEALTSRAHITFSIGRTAVRSPRSGRVDPLRCAHLHCSGYIHGCWRAQETFSQGSLGQTQPVSRVHQRTYGKRGKGIRRCVAGDCAWND